MSAYASAVFQNHVEVLSDSAIITGSEFRLDGIGRKCFAISNLPLVLTARGDMLVLAHYGEKLRLLAAAAGTVDGTLAGFAEFLESEKASGRKFEVAQDFLIAGISESLGPFHRLVCGYADNPGGFPAFQLIEIPQLWIGGNLTNSEFAASGFYSDSFDRGLAENGIALFEAFRAKPVFNTANADPICTIGGHLHLRIITRAGIGFETLGYWPDRIGESLDPALEFFRLPRRL